VVLIVRMRTVYVFYIESKKNAVFVIVLIIRH